ncbi:MAG: large conductance mechanosensitive channel protein MscL [Clostridia bacterium]|nr:large conductance mechanosensitive channel protein MscL [Clostridia bacterium]
MANAEKKALKEQKKAEKKAMKAHLKAQKTGFWSDFKKFITKGNVLDLAVAVVIGSAFNAITNGLVKFIINPCITLFTGDISLEELKTVLREAVVDDAGAVTSPEVAILWGEWIQTIIQFLIIAFSIFVFVRVFKKMSDKLHYKEIEEKKVADAKKKEEDDAKAAAAAAVAAEKEAQLQAFYKNVEKQTELLEKLANK